MNIGKIPSKAARLTPAKDALIDVPNNRRLSYAALDLRIIKLANALLDNAGLKKGDRVAILSKNCIQYMEIFYACARVGLIAQPLNWRLGEDELGRIVQDGAPRILIASAEYEKLAATLTAAQHNTPALIFGNASDDAYEQLLHTGREAEPAQSGSVGGDDAALILYTGGTTGESKGALHTHKTLFMGMLNQTVAERVLSTDVYMLTGQMFHIPVALAMNYMAHGCPVVLINFEAKLALDVIKKSGSPLSLASLQCSTG